MADRFTHDREAIVEDVLNTPGDLAAPVRAAIYSRAAETNDAFDNLPSELLAFIDKVIREAYKITDADIERLLQAGYSEDAVFEAIASAAVGAGMMRIECGLAAMQK